MSISIRLFGRRRQVREAAVKVGPEWFDQISTANRLLLLEPWNGLSRERVGRWVTTSVQQPDASWKMALSTLGAEWSYRVHGSADDLAALQTFFAFHIDGDGSWLTPIDRVEHAMKGYSLIYLAQVTNELRYRKAADRLAASLLENHPRVSDGSLPYRPHSQEILVDSLAMICPFLARYARLYASTDALSVSAHQLKQFVLNSVDHETYLPYHGYYADGPKRLGLQGWGRGTGWYMLGLIDTLIEMPKDHADYTLLLDAYVAAAYTLRRYQRPNGHWHWAILHQQDVPDSSATSLVGYSLTRGLQAGLLDESFRGVIDAAIQALVDFTRPDGVVDGALGECRGLGKYPQFYGPQPWLQGAATAFAAQYLAGFGDNAR